MAKPEIYARSRRAAPLALAACLLALATPSAWAQAEAEPEAESKPKPEAGAPAPSRKFDGTLTKGARPPAPADARPLATTRTELAGLPAIAGNNVFGLLLGVTGSYTRFDPDHAPFRFRAQLTAVASLQGTDSGLRSPLQNIDLRLDFPSLFEAQGRVYVMLRYQRIENVGYWGIGNGVANRIPDDYAGPRDRFFTWKKQLLQANVFGRYGLVTHLELVVGLGARGVFPELWPDTKLTRDLRSPGSPQQALLYGYTRQFVGDGLVGLLWDTRDDEFNPQRGGYHELSFRAGAGPTRDRPVRYGSTYLHLRWFLPLLGEQLVLGLRALADVGFGAMPLLELGTMGGYTTLGGPASIEANRALPYGRQLGQVKLFGTLELRSTFYRFELRRHRFALGAAGFVDASRVAARLRDSRGLDQGGPPLLASIGGGLRLIWGSALVLRLDVGAAPGADIAGKTHIGASFALGHAF